MSSAAEIRARKQIIPVTLPGTDLVIECRRPDLLSLVSRGWIDWPALQQIQATFAPAESAGVVLDNRPVPTPIEKARLIGTFLDEFVCAAAVRPRVVLTEAEVTDAESILWVDDLTLDEKMTVLAALVGTPPAVTEFRREESPGDPGGPSGAAVRDAPVDAVVGAG